jgi:hypothetical protein
MKAEDDFWSALTALLRDDDDHNTRMVRDFSKISKIPEHIVWQKLRAALRHEGVTQ